MKVDSNINFTGSLMLYLETEAVLEVAFLTDAASMRHYSQKCIQ